MKAWPLVKLGDLLEQIDRMERVDPNATYHLLGVRLEGNGPFIRETVTGAETSAGRLNQVQSGDFIYSRLFAWRGAFGVITDAMDGCFVSNEFPIFRTNQERLDVGYLARWFQLPNVWRKVEENCTGSTPTTRNRFKEQFFFDLEIPLPPLTEQQALVARLDALAEKARQVEAHLDAVERDAERLIRSYIFGREGERPVKRRMSELVSQRQPDVAVDGTAQYRFAGVYSFGRGVFPSAIKMGSEFAYQRLSTVRAGDFIYPKLMAWEGALGVVPPGCDGMVVSPEFPVFTVNTEAVLPEVLDIYFRTPEVWPTLAEISGGTNARRRRLQPTAFLSYEMPVPPMDKQLELRAIYQHAQTLKAKHSAIREANAALLPATLERVFSTGVTDHA
ncbi:type I restriction enzyme, S subunit [Andreprevotia lacus DSM 23236]|jgi:type I restriction enzyme S subunit|uniref:Type I restriction enzyme, S subunit n=1 Tax=Andreprevotia lacus DSM 23236 TaxID=1121001 RepID=A0A1W1XCG3_9NEIS|nr:restriction endonuclease subunit S [Andreprevotia lacus]SMC21378.1 type I restriction enzyme, S subunit [Andreprevotia lacus DSM 23236]